MKFKKLLKNTLGGVAMASALLGLSGCYWLEHDDYRGSDGDCTQHVYDGGSCRAPQGFGEDSHSVVDTELYRLDKSVPSMVALGETFECHYTLNPKKYLSHLSLTDKIPEGVTVVSTMPEATMRGDEMVWGFHNVRANEVVEVTVTMRADTVGDLCGCAYVEAVPLACTLVRVGEPMLTVEKTGPSTARVGEDIVFNINVENSGNYPVHDVVIRDMVPAGLEHHTGSKDIVMEVGTIEPGCSICEQVHLTAVGRGTQCNVVEVSSSTVGTVQSEACVDVLECGVSIRKSGPADQYVDKTATYYIEVVNIGDTVLEHVEVRDVLPCEYELLSASGNYHQSGNVLVWEEFNMAPGASRAYEVLVANCATGEFCNEATATADDLPCVSDDLCTTWTGYPAIRLETVDTCDPLLVGEETTYIIRVTNQGSAPDYNIAINASVPSELMFVRASGVTPYNVSGQVVAFESLPVLNAGQMVEYRVAARAVGLGDARFKVEMNSDILDGPLREEESTHVY